MVAAELAPLEDVPLLVQLADPLGFDVYGDQHWRARARCRGVSPEVFMPTKGMSHEPALAHCRECPARLDCIEYALSQPHATPGIWGSSYRDRRTARHFGWSAAELLELLDRR